MKNRKPADENLDINGQPKPKFDLRVTHRHPRTGEVIKHDPYILRVVGEIGSADRTQLWERPAGSGNLYDFEMNPVGRWIYEEKTVKGKKVKVGHYDAEAAHIEWIPPETEDQKIAKENAALKAELAALKAEKEKTAQPQTKKQDKGA